MGRDCPPRRCARGSARRASSTARSPLEPPDSAGAALARSLALAALALDRACAASGVHSYSEESESDSLLETIKLSRRRRDPMAALSPSSEETDGRDTSSQSSESSSERTTTRDPCRDELGGRKCSDGDHTGVVPFSRASLSTSPPPCTALAASSCRPNDESCADTSKASSSACNCSASA